MRKHLVIFVVCSIIALIIQGGCSSTSSRFENGAVRGPASHVPISYPINSRFERVPENESDSIKSIAESFRELQQQKFGIYGKYLRGTHAKGICLDAQLEVFDVAQTAPSVATRVKKGIFSVPGKYDARARFANADGGIHADKEKDVRAVSFAVSFPKEISNPQGRMDFAMNDNPVFPISDAQVFADVLKLKLSPLGSLANAVTGSGGRVLTAIIAAKNGEAEQKKEGNTPYQKLRYWSTVPFALGADEAVKYSLKPCDSNKFQALTDDSDALSKELIRNNQQDEPTCFDFQVQLLEASRMTDPAGNTQKESVWIENALMLWSEEQAPFYTVGRLTLKQNSVVDQSWCEKWHISVFENNSDTHHGLGGINRARTAAENISYEGRRNR